MFCFSFKFIQDTFAPRDALKTQHTSQFKAYPLASFSTSFSNLKTA